MYRALQNSVHMPGSKGRGPEAFFVLHSRLHLSRSMSRAFILFGTRIHLYKARTRVFFVSLLGLYDRRETEDDFSTESRKSGANV